MAKEKEAPPAEEPAPDYRAEIDALKKQLQESGMRAQVLEKTLAALAREQPAPAPSAEGGYNYNPPPIPLATRERLKHSLGWSDADIEQHWKIIGSYFSEMSQPYAVAIGQLADNVDYTRTRMTTKDYEQFEEDIEKEFSSRMKSGKPASRKELYEVVRSRRQPEIIEKEVEKRMQERENRGAQASAAHTESNQQGGISATRPTPMTKTGPLTRESFEKMSIEDKEKALGDTPF